MVAGFTRRWERVQGLAAESNEAAALTLENMASLRPKALFALRLAAAGAAVELMCLGLAFLPTFPAGLLSGWLGTAGLQVTAAVLLRNAFYRLPVPIKHVAALRK